MRPFLCLLTCGTRNPRLFLADPSARRSFLLCSLHLPQYPRNMKTLLLSLITAFLFMGCSSTEKQPADAPKPKAKPGEKPYKDKPEPKLGMSKDEIQQIWGKPKRVNGTPAGE